MASSSRRPSAAFVSDGPNLAGIADLAVSSHRGPDLDLPFSCRPPRSIDQQLDDAATSLQGVREDHRRVEKAIQGSRRLAERPKSGRPRPPARPSSGLRMSNPSQAQEMLKIQQDPRWRELQSLLDEDEDEEAEVAAVNFGATQARDAKHAQWRQQLVQNVRNLLDTVRLAQLPEVAERQLAEAHEWFLRCRRPEYVGHGPRDGSSGPHFNDFLADETMSRMPGSAFYSAGEDDRGLPRSNTEEEEVPKEVQRPAEIAGRAVQQVQLPAAKDRIYFYGRKHIVSPLTARKLKAATGGCDTPDFLERPITPSTATGGYTARSARSTPTPTLGSRPGSAMSYMTESSMPTYRGSMTPRSGMPRNQLRPASAAPAMSQQVPGIPMSVLEEPRAEVDRPFDDCGVERAPPYPATLAEQKMEERWVVRRNRQIVNQVIHKEQKGAIQQWSERRARVEEEISRNCEAARFQSDLQRRSYASPPDAAEDIEATVPEDEAIAATAIAGPSPQATLRRPKEIPRFDVSQPTSFHHQAIIRFAEDENKTKHPPPLNSRIAHLRKIHANLIRGDDLGDEGQEDEGRRHSKTDLRLMSAQGGEGEQQFASLSAYAPASGDEVQKAVVAPRMQDHSDVLIALCDWWKIKHNMDMPTPGDSGINLDEMRFKQLTEVEEIKRVFARRNCPINVAVLERALVMPNHRLQPGATNGTYIFNTMPNLMPNPFAVKRMKKKKKKGGKSSRASSAGSKKDSKSPGPPKKKGAAKKK